MSKIPAQYRMDLKAYIAGINQFHPDGSLTSYSEMLPGVSEDPASPHFGDQMRLASQVELRPDYFYLRELERNAVSRIDIVVTGASPPMAKKRGER